METLINLIPWLLAITCASLYYFLRKKYTVLKTQAKDYDNSLESREKAIIELRKEKTDLSWKVNNLTSDLEECKKHLKESQERVDPEENKRITQALFRANERIIQLESREQAEAEKPVDVRLFVDHYEDKRFKNSAILNLHSIELRDEELIKEDYIKVIRSLAGKGYFSEEIQSKFGYNAKTGRATFNLIALDNDGDPQSFKTWKDFLIERELFTKTVTEYIQQVIGQREINKAVDEALKGKEAVSA